MTLTEMYQLDHIVHDTFGSTTTQTFFSYITALRSVRSGSMLQLLCS